MELTLAIAALKVVGYGLAAIGPGIGIGVATYGLCVSAARQPEMKGQLMGYFFITNEETERREGGTRIERTRT